MPVVLPSSAVTGLLTRARRTLGMSQEEFGKRFRASRRTAGRWEGGGAIPHASTLLDIARAVHPENEELAAALAGETGATLADMGLGAPPPAPAPPPRAYPATKLVVESVVCAAVEEMKAEPAAARAVLRAAFGRARALGLSVEEVDEALAVAVAGGDAKKGAVKPRIQQG